MYVFSFKTDADEHLVYPYEGHAISNRSLHPYPRGRRPETVVLGYDVPCPFRREIHSYRDERLCLREQHGLSFVTAVAQEDIALLAPELEENRGLAIRPVGEIDGEAEGIEDRYIDIEYHHVVFGIEVHELHVFYIETDFTGLVIISHIGEIYSHGEGPYFYICYHGPQQELQRALVEELLYNPAYRSFTEPEGRVDSEGEIAIRARQNKGLAQGAVPEVKARCIIQLECSVRYEHLT